MSESNTPRSFQEQITAWVKYVESRYGSFDAYRQAQENNRNSGSIANYTWTRTGTGAYPSFHGAFPFTSYTSTSLTVTTTNTSGLMDVEPLPIEQSPVPILAKRVIKINDRGFLTSMNSGIEPLKTVQEARCTKYDGWNPNEIPDSLQYKHPAPHQNCTCGFYALTLDNMGNSYDTGHWAEVELYGRVIESGHEVPTGEMTAKLVEVPYAKWSLLNDHYLAERYEVKRVPLTIYKALGYRAQYQRILRVHIVPSNLPMVAWGVVKFSRFMQTLKHNYPDIEFLIADDKTKLGGGMFDVHKSD